MIFHIDPVGNTHLSRPKKCYEILRPVYWKTSSRIRNDRVRGSVFQYSIGTGYPKCFLTVICAFFDMRIPGDGFVVTVSQGHSRMRRNTYSIRVWYTSRSTWSNSVTAQCNTSAAAMHFADSTTKRIAGIFVTVASLYV